MTQATDDALRAEIADMSHRFHELDEFLRSPSAQRVSDSERAAMRHQLRAQDDTLYWLRHRAKLRGLTR